MREAVVNDCGTRDVWPLFAKSTTWGYGNSGTYGFGSAQVTDRFHALDHGGYFNAGFVKKYWVPFVAKGVIAASNVERAGAHTPAWFQVLELPYKWLAMAAAMCAAAAYLLLPGAGIGPVAATDPIGAMLGRWNYEGITCAEGIDVAKVGDHLVFRTAGTPDYLHAIRKIDGGTVMTEVLSPEAEKGNLYALEPTGTKLSVRNLTAGQNDEWDRCP